MAKHYRTKVVQPVDLVSDMADLLDLAGIDGVDKRHLDNVLHAGNRAESLLEFAAASHRQRSRRISYAEMIGEFLGGAK